LFNPASFCFEQVFFLKSHIDAEEAIAVSTDEFLTDVPTAPPLRSGRSPQTVDLI
jgi:hypothetical protein